MEKLIISTAVTGGVTMPSQTPYLPITPQQIADEAVRAAEAGAASVHIHARNPKDGSPSMDIEVYRDIITRIKEKSNVIICITTGGSLFATQEERIRVVPTFKPELASFNMGCLTFSVHQLAERIKEFKYPWEKEFLQRTKSSSFGMSFADLEYFCQTMSENGTKQECECYHLGHIHNVSYFVKQGLLSFPI